MKMLTSLRMLSRLTLVPNKAPTNHRTFFSKISTFFRMDSGSKDQAKDKAYGDMIEAVRELSRGQHGLPKVPGVQMQSVSNILPSKLRELSNQDIHALSIDELLELARSHYDGDFGDGGDVRVNKTQAATIWKLIVERDPSNCEAKYCLASSYRKGEGIRKDAAEAFLLMHELANKYDYYLAHYDVAVMYATNEGVAPSTGNDKEALTHFRKAAKAGVRPALYNIANFLAAGRGVENKNQDSTAAKYYAEAAEAGDPAAMFAFGTWIVQGRGGLSKDYKKAFDWQCRAGQAGHPGAMYNAACHLMTGQGCAIDKPLAAQWFQKCVDAANIPEACVNLGNMYRDGNGVEKDLLKARSLYARHSMTHEGSRTNLFLVEQLIKKGDSSSSQ